MTWGAAETVDDTAGLWGRPPAGGWGAPALDGPTVPVRRPPRHPARHGPAPRPGPPPHRPSGHVRRRRALVAAVLVAVAATLAFWTPGWLVIRYLDDAALVRGVQRVLVEDHGLAATDVRCPARVEVVAGAAFACTAVVDRARVDVPVRLVDRAGTYAVGRPA